MICTPTADEEYKYPKVDVNSLEAQRQVIEQVREFEREAEKAHETNHFHGCDRPYCQTCRKIREKLRNHDPILLVKIKFREHTLPSSENLFCYKTFPPVGNIELAAGVIAKH